MRQVCENWCPRIASPRAWFLLVHIPDLMSADGADARRDVTVRTTRSTWRLAALLVSMAACGDGDVGASSPTADADGDTIQNQHEQPDNTDGDAYPDYLDLDSDGDGIGDDIEAGDAERRKPPVDSD